jgi:hypothetical protein
MRPLLRNTNRDLVTFRNGVFRLLRSWQMKNEIWIEKLVSGS